MAVVNARELHTFLESKQQFADWIKNRIYRYDFEEGTDFVVFHKDMKNSKGGRTSIEYAITVTMAKELAMLKFEHRLKTTKKALFGVSFLF